MNWIPSKVGAEPKKMAILGGLFVTLIGVYFYTRTPSAPEAAPVAQPSFKQIPDIPGSVGARNVPAVSASPGPRLATRNTSARGDSQARASQGRSMADFRPSLKLKEGVDVSSIDPSIHLDLIAKVRNVTAAGGVRSLFEFGQAPPPPPPPVKDIFPGPVPSPAPTPQPPPALDNRPPPPPPIPLKFYGYSGTVRASGARRAFFLDGEDIFVAAENELIRNRYKIVRIGVNSAVVEDTQSKSQQTLPLIEELGG